MFLTEKDLEETVNDVLRMFVSRVKEKNLVPKYTHFLEDEHPNHVAHYRNRLKTNPEGAIAEAVTFHFFRSNLDTVQVNEEPNKGGVDFLCKIGSSEFIAEITSLQAETVTRKSGLEHKPTKRHSVRPFSPITRKLCDTVYDKAFQMSGYNCPGVLVIACKHPLGGVLFDSSGAERLLVGDIKIGLSSSRESTNVTELKDSCFLRYNQEWELGNRSISSILLFHISEVSASVLGILHPNPTHKFLPEFLPSIPFLRLKQWPPNDNKIKTEWVKYEKTELIIPIPEQHGFWYDLSLNEPSMSEMSPKCKQ